MINEYDVIASSPSDAEKIAIIDDILSSLDQYNERIEKNQKAIEISKIETRAMLDQLKELTKNAG